MTCDKCGWEGMEGVLGDTKFTHDCAGRRIAAELAKERSRIAVVIRRVSARWAERGKHEFALLLNDISWAIEQETTK